LNSTLGPNFVSPANRPQIACTSLEEPGPLQFAASALLADHPHITSGGGFEFSDRSAQVDASPAFPYTSGLHPARCLFRLSFAFNT
jgi:hypothetical protein